MQIFLAVTPDEARAAAQFCPTQAHVAYRIGPGSTLLRSGLPPQPRGGLLCVSDREAPAVDDPAALCQAVLRECGRFHYQGVLLDLETVPSAGWESLLRQLDSSLSAKRLSLYLPERDALPGSKGIPLICTALSGGNFKQMLQEAAARRGGASHLALDVQRLRMDFRLPCPTGEGEPLSQEAFESLFRRESPAVFFSPDLCARYFTYTQNGEHHFVLFDDAGTLRQKLKVGASMGFSAAFFMWPEIRDIAGALFQ